MGDVLASLHRFSLGYRITSGELGGKDVPISRIISVDGGGVRGVIPVIVLQRLRAEPGLEDLLDRVDFLAGTSTGGLIALGLAAGIDVAELRRLYEERAAEVFADSFFDDVKDLGKLLGADYHVANLEREVHRVLGDITLAELEKRVLITAFDLDNEDPNARSWKPKLFHNFPGGDSDGDALAYRVATATAASPTYFETFDGYVDGGVFAINPSMCAVAQTQDSRIPVDERADLHEVRLLSLGTGRSLRHIEGDKLDWGYVQWVRPLLDLIFDGVNGIADFQCSQVLGERYHRVAPTFPPGRQISQDAVDEIPYLTEFASNLDLTGTISWLQANW
jgi:predicted acylesterase/phospholipase RssA